MFSGSVGVGLAGAKLWSVDRTDAEAIYEQGREAVVAVLLRMDEQITRLEKRVEQQDERIAKLEQKAKRSSRNSSRLPRADLPDAPPKRGKDSSGKEAGRAVRS